ncbi:hypothetical protein JYJ95_20150 [Corallococcus exiguus]|uniref:hypothetical protein n=1 Tax=Corallococcus exiguus TaxID=83462 RepID=UPI001A8ED9DB|nr:hypothetical protein [Corallococcus exiguus]MBN8468819.1 hypothetical protein [Corallococcus exiguus]
MKAALLGWSAFLAVGCWSHEDAGEAQPEVSDESVQEATRQLVTQFDVAHYVIPSCSAAVSYATKDSNGGVGIFRYIPMGTLNGAARFVYVKNPDGKDFEEFTADGSYIRLWTDSSFAYLNPQTNSDYCDEQCGGRGVPTDCRRQWEGTPGDYAYQAPRDASNTNLGGPRIPRFIPLDNQVHTYSFVSHILSKHENNCTDCDSWHEGDNQGNTISVQHLDSVTSPAPLSKKFTDVIKMSITAGPGAGETYYYARGMGWVGYQSGGYWNWVTGRSSATPVPSLSCLNYSQGSFCSAIPNADESAPCSVWDGDVSGCDAHGISDPNKANDTQNCAYYFCSNSCRPQGTSNCEAGCSAYCNSADSETFACRTWNGNVSGCDAHGISDPNKANDTQNCAYYFCSNSCRPQGTSNCEAGCYSYCF